MFRATIYNRIIFLLLALLSLLTLSSCTVIGIAIGSAVDHNGTKRELAYFEADSCSCKTGNEVMISLISGESVEGRILKIQTGESIIILVLDNMTTTYQINNQALILWQDIHSITIISSPESGRVIFTAIGLAIDLYILDSLRGLGRAFSSMGA